MRSRMACSRIKSSGGEMASSAPVFLVSRARTGKAKPPAATTPERAPTCKSARRDVALFMTPLLSRTKETSGKSGGSRRAAGSAAYFPPHFLGETVEEIEVVGAFRGLAHPLVDPFGVGGDQDAPAVGLDGVEDDLGGLGGAGRRVLDEAPRPFLGKPGDVAVRQVRHVDAHRGHPRAHLGDFLGVHRVRVVAALDLARVLDDRSADMARHDDGALDVRRVDAQVGLQRLAKALHRELGSAVGGMRDGGADGSPEAVDAAGVYDVTPVRLEQHRQAAPRAVLYPEPAEVVGALPFATT